MRTFQALPPHAGRLAGFDWNYNESVRTVTVRKFDSFEVADRADKAYYWSLTPNERLRMMCELCALRVRSRHDPTPRLARVYRIIELAQR
ncbi:hypothetical protein SBA6_890023 [Candidatus Sulfopaludibacter sp. SbA6]|nr:hypothetical protein SBA6_890023 [Candidatus Sulfopaludibacter sp. SbA6]